MFKLIKILNMGANVPEPEMRPCDPNVPLKAGTCLMYDISHNMVYPNDQITYPSHVLIKDINKGDNFALCYRLSSNMVFEVPLIGNPANVCGGMTLELVCDDNGAYAVSDKDGGPAFVYSIENATKSSDKVLVTFCI